MQTTLSRRSEEKLKEKRFVYTALTLGLMFGVGLSVCVPEASASRNSAGSYSLPSGNPVVSGTPVSSTWANNTMSDISTELTNSLDRQGRGAMTAPLQCSNGTVGTPSLTFASDTDTGLYRIGANNPGMSTAATLNQSWSTTGSTFALGLAVNQSQSNTTALTATGNGTASGATLTGGATGTGVIASGGATSGRGGFFTGSGASAGARGTGGSTSGIGIEGYGGAPNGHGAVCEGDGTGDGLRSTGGDSSGAGVYALGGPPNGIAVRAIGDGTGQGLYATGGDSAGDGVKGVGGATNGNGGVFDGSGTGAGIVVGTGGARFNGTPPASTTAVSNRIYSSNIIKAWANIVSNGTLSPTVSSSFNITSVVCGGSGNNDYIVTMASPMTGTNDYAVVLSSGAANGVPVNNSATVFTIAFGGDCDTSSGYRPNFIVMGYQ